MSLHVVEAGKGGDPLLILLHAFPDLWWTWRRSSRCWYAGYHVIAPDMRSYNRSDAPPAVSAYRLDTLATDVAALADAYGAERFRLVGHDGARWSAGGWRRAIRSGWSACC